MYVLCIILPQRHFLISSYLSENVLGFLAIHSLKNHFILASSFGFVVDVLFICTLSISSVILYMKLHGRDTVIMARGTTGVVVDSSIIDRGTKYV
jgi:hypothetical protein